MSIPSFGPTGGFYVNKRTGVSSEVAPLTLPVTEGILGKVRGGLSTQKGPRVRSRPRTGVSTRHTERDVRTYGFDLKRSPEPGPS